MHNYYLHWFYIFPIQSQGPFMSFSFEKEWLNGQMQMDVHLFHSVFEISVFPNKWSIVNKGFSTITAEASAKSVPFPTDSNWDRKSKKYLSLPFQSQINWSAYWHSVESGNHISFPGRIVFRRVMWFIESCGKWQKSTRCAEQYRLR